MKIFSAVMVAGLAAAAVACSDATPTQPGADVRYSASQGGLASVLVEVKFNEEYRIRSIAGELRSTRGRSAAALSRVLAKHASREVRPLFSMPEQRLEGLVNAATARSGRAAPDLGSWYQLLVPEGSDASSFIAELNALSEVDTAYLAPAPAPPPGMLMLVTPDFSSRQTELGAAPIGSEAAFARAQPGGGGQGIKIVDMEYDWTFGHEDLGLDASILIGGERYTGFGPDHGTAVLGQLGARNNGFGVTGAVPDATLRVVGTFFGGGYRPANGIAIAATDMAVGDVLLLEQQTGGPNGRFVPLEWVPSVYEATLVATRAGRIVVAAAGNGSENLDAPEFDGRFDRSRYDSGAIIVGAGNATHGRLAFSTYGSRIDLQGRGIAVTTTGYGDLSGTSELDYYTASFGGTSSASPIVTAAVAAIQGYMKASGRDVLSAQQIVTVLNQTGSPQTGNLAEPIGAFPNLRAALARVAATPNWAPVAIAGGPYTGSEGAAVSFDGSGSWDPERSALTYAWDFGDGTTANGASASHTYASSGTYTATLTVRDVNDAVGTATAAVTVANVAPLVDAGADATVPHRETFTLTARFSDPGQDTWTCTVEWGDRTDTETVPGCNPSSGVTATHAYKRRGTYTVRVTVTDGEDTTTDELLVTQAKKVPGKGKPVSGGS